MLRSTTLSLILLLICTYIIVFSKNHNSKENISSCPTRSEVQEQDERSGKKPCHCQGVAKTGLGWRMSQEPRVMAAQGVPALMESNPAGTKHSRKSWVLVIGCTESPRER